MTKYKQFLESIGVISEELFNDIINSLPEVDILPIELDIYSFDSMDEISQRIIDFILSDWNYVYSDSVNFENKTFEINDVESLKDLEEIKKTFDKWTITNYEDTKAYLEDEEERNKLLSDEAAKINVVISIVNTLNMEQLDEIIAKYGYKK